MLNKHYVRAFLMGAYTITSGCISLVSNTPNRPASMDEASQTMAESNVRFRKLKDSVWLHESKKDVGPPWGMVTANGLVVVGKKGIVVVDTGWSAKDAQEIVAWVQKTFGKKPKAAVITHSHSDRAGGVEAMLEHGIAVHALAQTKAMLRQKNDADVLASINAFAASVRIDLGSFDVEAFFPGAGHTEDNVAVYASSVGVLFGGCLVRALADDALGYVAEADIQAWPSSVARLQKRYRKAEMVVPGHGKEGLFSLLQHTIDIAHAAGH